MQAIECHTTLKSHASKIDMIVFIADKISWDQKGTPPYLDSLEKCLDLSLENGICFYLKYMWQNRNKLQVIHPWFKNAYEYFVLSKNDFLE